MKNNINNFLAKLKEKVNPFAAKIDTKLSKIIPDIKLRKIVYFSLLGLVGFVTLIFTIAIFSLVRIKSPEDSLLLKKPIIKNTSPIPQKDLTQIQKELMDIFEETKILKFPESIFNIPQIEREISI